MKLDKWSKEPDQLLLPPKPQSPTPSSKSGIKPNENNQSFNINLSNLRTVQIPRSTSKPKAHKTMDSVSWLRDLHKREEEFKTRMSNMHKRQLDRLRQEEHQQRLTDRLNEEEEKKKLAIRHAEGKLTSHA